MLKSRDIPRLHGVNVGNLIGVRRLMARSAGDDVVVLKDLEAIQGQNILTSEFYMPERGRVRKWT
jgi:hypothetical protein